MCNQLIVGGMGTVLDIDLKAVKLVMDMFGVDKNEQPLVFKKVAATARHIITEHRDD